MTWILSYGCSSAGGRGAEGLWKSLAAGVCHAEAPSFESPAGLKAALWPSRKPGATALEDLTAELLASWREVLSSSDPETLAIVRGGKRFGAILASTKGCVDDFVWDRDHESGLSRDTLSPVLQSFLARAELSPARSLCVSNACASSLSALFLAKHWIESRALDRVIVLAADRVGPFTMKGFHCLQALSAGGSRPFSLGRDGLRLGDGAAAILLGSRPGAFKLQGVGLDAEGFAVTRASESGASLVRACRRIPGFASANPDLILAHATGTLINDAVEDRAFLELFDGRVPVTASKPSIGHALGASGAMDIIAACEALGRKRAFRIAGGAEPDPELSSNYLHRRAGDSPEIPFDGSRVLVTSLGFGGIHAGALISREAS